MSCWVAPALAAEYWRISLEDMASAMREGRVMMRIEHGFTFVDVLPGDEHLVPGRRTPRARAPLTYVTLSEEELAALVEEAEGEEESPLDEETTDRPAFGTAGWRDARQQAARRRIGPGHAGA